MALSPSATRLLVVSFVALGSLTYGYCSSIIATTLGQPSFLTYFELDTNPNAVDLFGAINGLFQVGGLVGALSSSVLADWLGRRKAMLIESLFAVVGGALQAGSVHIGMYILARFITGIGVGALVTLVPLYQSEIAPPRIRGLLVGMHGVLIGTGYAVAGWIGVGFYFVNAAGAQWRLSLAIQCLPPLLLAAGILFLPESPRWLIIKNEEDLAFDSFKSIRAESNDAMLHDEPALRAEFDILSQQIKQELANSIGFSDLLKQKSMRKRCLIGFLTMFAAQATATITINNYGPSLYSALGFSTVPQLVMAACWVSIAPFGNYFNAYFVDAFGRVRMLNAGLAGCLLALVGECITVDIFDRTGSRGAASGAVFFLFLHVTVFTFLIDATTYIYAAEIFPTPLRAKGMAVSVSGLFIATIIFLEAAPTAFANIGWRFYLLFISLTAVNMVLVYIFFPETRKRSLEDIDELFGGSIELSVGVEVASSQNDEKTSPKAIDTDSQK
ncbi:MFS transporter [Stachybotrys elegans]|uniref:MFS transporter n=1 Tax=Stachybotrys elegans TaxID=80388 RepID=A0A8K0WLY6_9HYPO|nr:MFS transporter [Stachybotrys elegans]